MTIGKRRSIGYELPDPVSPYELICFRVYVPKHTLYIGAFWGAYQFFTSWLAWVKDPLRRGKEAAALWRIAYDKARAEFDITKGRCEMNVTGIRQNPNNKCEIQVEFDGNNQWVTVADMKDCNGCGGGGAMQYDGVNVSIYNDCTEQFEPSGTPYNPIQSNIYDSLYSPDTEGQCNGAANIANWMHDASQSGLSAFNTIDSVAAATITIVGFIISGAGSNLVYDVLLALLVIEWTTQADWWGDAANEDITEDVQNLLAQFTSGDGTLREPNYTAAVDAMEAMRDAQTPDTSLRARWGVEWALLKAVGSSIVSRQNKYAGITDADCSAAGWTQVFDFATSKQGWVIHNMVSAVYVAGEGWKDNLVFPAPAGQVRLIQIKVGFAPSTITAIAIHYDAILGTNTASDELEHRDTGWAKQVDGVLSTVDNVLTLGGEHVYNWAGSQAGVDTVVASLVVGHDSTDPYTDPAGDATISKIVLSGTGANPFN